MLDVRCSSCQSSYQIDERRVSATGLRMRCPKCGHSFVVQRDGAVEDATRKEPNLSADDAPELPARQAPRPAAPPAAAAGPAIGAPLAPRRPKLRSIHDAEPAPPPAPVGAPHAAFDELPARAPRGGAPPLARPTLAEGTAVTAARARSSVPPTANDEPFGELDWGAVERSAAALETPSVPAVVERARQQSQLAPHELDEDFAPALARPGARPANLPSAFDLDLPAATEQLPDSPWDLPAGREPARLAGAPPRPTPSLGELELLPDLFDAALPSASQAALPSVAPTVLPSTAPSVLPARNPSLPVRASVLPSRSQPPAAPLPPGSLPPPPPPLLVTPPAMVAPSFPPNSTPWGELNGFGETLDGGGFGELDLPPLPSDDGAPPSSHAPQTAQASDFGELDLGPLLDAVPAPRGQSAAPPPSGAGTLLEVGAGAQPAGKHQAAPIPARAKRRGLLLVGLLAAGLLGGAALEFSPLGAFGRHAIGDRLQQETRTQRLQRELEAMQAALQTDLYTAHTDASARLEQALLSEPRAFNLHALLAFSYAYTDLRFGADPTRGVRSAAALAKAQEHADADWLALASAAVQSVAAPNTPRALAFGDAGLALEASLLDGFAALQSGDDAAAAARFEQVKPHGGVRALYGLAAAHAHAEGTPEPEAETLTALLAAAPEHAEGLLLSARAWQHQKQPERALEQLLKLPAEGVAPRTTASALALQGTLQLALGHPDLANAAFERAYAADPSNLDALLGQGEALFLALRYDDALARFEAAASHAGGAIEPALGVAKSKLQKGQADDARTILQRIVAAFPDDPRGHYWLGEAQGYLGRTDDALAEFELAVRGFKADAAEAVLPYTAAARLLKQRGDEGKARAWLDRAKAALPASAGLERAVGELAVSVGRYDEAARAFRRALEHAPSDHALRLLLAETLRKDEKYTEAERELNLLQKAAPELAGLDLERGLWLEQRGQIAAALTVFQQALAKAPDQPEQMLRVGAAYLAIGRPSEALPLLEAAQRLQPTSAEAQHLLGRARLMHGAMYTADAVRLLQRATELDPSVPAYFVYLAQAANESLPPRTAQAREAADRALALDQLDGDAYWQRGVSHLKEGSYVSASEDLRRAVALRPERAGAWASLAEASEAQSQYPAAMSAWARAVQLDPKPPYWRYRYAHLIAQRGSRGDAVAHIRYAVVEGAKLEVRPGWLTPALFEAAELFRHAGLRREAVAAYTDFLANAPASSPDRRDAEQALRALK